jgi:hypothetical protein
LVAQVVAVVAVGTQLVVLLQGVEVLAVLIEM